MPHASSLPRSNLSSVKPLSQSSSSQSLSATATPFNPKCQNCMLNYPTAPPKFQTLSASPPLCQVFFSPLKRISDYLSSSGPSKLITLPTSVSSSFEIQQSSQLKFQPPSNIIFPLVSTVIFSYTPTFPSSSILSAHPSFFAAPPTSRHYLVPHPPLKILPAAPSFSLNVEQHITEEIHLLSYLMCHVS